MFETEAARGRQSSPKIQFFKLPKNFTRGLGGLYEEARQIPVPFTIYAKLNFLGHQVA